MWAKLVLGNKYCCEFHCKETGVYFLCTGGFKETLVKHPRIKELMKDK